MVAGTHLFLIKRKTQEMEFRTVVILGESTALRREEAGSLRGDGLGLFLQGGCLHRCDS